MLRRTVHLRRILDGVQGTTHGGVADRVDVRLEARGIHGLNRFREVLLLPHQHSVVVHAAAVWLEQRAGLVLDDPVGEELHAVGGEQR